MGRNLDARRPRKVFVFGRELKNNIEVFIFTRNLWPIVDLKFARRPLPHSTALSVNISLYRTAASLF